MDGAHERPRTLNEHDERLRLLESELQAAKDVLSWCEREIKVLRRKAMESYDSGSD